MEKMYFGCAYYREYMPYERLEEDIALMKKAHINVVRIAESTWSTYEKQEGHFDFSSVMTVLDKMYENGISVIVGTPTYAIPSWLARKYPDVLAATFDGQNRYGARQLMDITHPVYRFYADRIIKKLMEAVHEHPAIIGYQLDNESKHYGVCSSNVQIDFVNYLKAKFNGDLAALNSAMGLDYWSNRIDAWEDVPDVRGTINGSFACEFQKFQRSLVTEFLQHQEQLVRPYLKEGQFITHNFDFEWRDYSFGVQSDVDHFKAHQCLDVVGVDIYHPSQEFLTGKEIAFGGDEIRSLQNKRYFVLETEAQAFKNWTPFPGQLKLQGIAHMASGARMISYWHWHSLHNSFETFWKGLLSHDLQPNPVYDEACELGAIMEKLGPALSGTHKDNKIALVVSNECLSAIDRFPYRGPSLNTVKFKYHLYNDVVRKYYDALYELNAEVDILSVDDDRIFDYDLLVCPLLYAVSSERLNKICAFVRNGGHAIFSFKSGFADEMVKVRTQIQPGLISEITGCTYQLIAEPHDVGLKSDELKLSDNTRCADFMEMVVPGSNTKVLARYDHKYYERYAAITYCEQQKAGEHGIGSAIYIGADVDKDVIKATLTYLLAKSGLAAFLPPVQFPIVVRSLINEHNEKITFVMNFSSEEQKVTLPQQYRDLLGNAELTVSEQGTELCLKDWGFAVLHMLMGA